MTDEDTHEDQENEVELGPIVTRLTDLQRKCRSVGSRNQDAADMEARIGTILDRLKPADDDDEPIPFGALARELYGVERFFESNGFLSVSKEVAHVERALEALASPEEVTGSVVPAESHVLRRELSQSDPEEKEEPEEKPSTWAVPKPLAVVSVLFVIAIAVCIVIIYGHRTGPQDVSTAPMTLPTAAPTAAPLPTSTPRARPPDEYATLSPGAKLAEEVGKARLALVEGDLETAINHISLAALIDSDHGSVLAAAAQVVEQLVMRADAAAEGGLWETAELTLARAGRIATRFGLDSRGIEAAAYRHSQMDRFTLLRPEKVKEIRAAAGKRVTVFLKNGSARESLINGVRGGELLLNEDTTVRGGTMYYVEEIPLAEIDYLKVWEK